MTLGPLTLGSPVLNPVLNPVLSSGLLWKRWTRSCPMGQLSIPVGEDGAPCRASDKRPWTRLVVRFSARGQVPNAVEATSAPSSE